MRDFIRQFSSRLGGQAVRRPYPKSADTGAGAGVSTRIMRSAPLFPVAAGMVTGIVLDGSLEASVFIYISLFVLASGMAALPPVRSWIGPVVIFVASACVGAMLHLSAARTMPASSIERYTSKTKRIARVRGTVVSEPRLLGPSPNPFALWTYGAEHTVFLLDVASIEGLDGDVAASGRVRVSVGEAVLDLRENERVEVFGWLYRPRPPRNPGGFDWSAFQRRQGVVATLRCDHRENVRRLDAGPPRRLSLITRLRTTVRGMLTDDLATGAEEEASLLEAMVLGHRSRLDRRLNEIFVRAGCIHFLAVSGVHVVIVMLFARLICRAFMAPPRVSICVMMVTVVAYALVAEPRPPILRASVIALLYCVSRLLGRERACLNWISASAILLCIVDPLMVFNVGFQLSFAAVFGVSYLSPALLAFAAETWLVYKRIIRKQPLAAEDRRLMDVRPTPQHLWSRLLRRGSHVVRRYTGGGLAVTVGAWASGFPIVAGCFQQVYPWGALNSLLAFPLVSAVMGLAFAKLIVGAILPGAGSVITGVLTAVDSLLIWFVQCLASLPGASMVAPSPPWWLLVSYYVFLLSFVFRFPRSVLISWAPAPVPGQQTTAQPRAPGHLCGVAFGIMVVCSTAWCWPKTPDGLTLTVLSVGAGSATVIELPDGRAVLYDVGSSNPYDVGRNMVVPYLRHRGITSIERIYLSHPNLDHFSGLPSVLEEVETGPIVVNEYFERRSPPRSPSRHLLDILAKREHPIDVLDSMTDRWELGGVVFELLSPRGRYDETLSTNDTSTVLRLSYEGHSILLTGDLEERTQRALSQRGDIRADVLLLPHHGGVRPSSKAFLEAVGADAVVRSSGQPMEETFNGLQEVVGVTALYNTADVGAVRVVIDSDGVHISSMHSTNEW